MIRNYLLVAFRNLKKDKWFALINIVGLTIGITASLIIFLHISHELSFDKFHKNQDNLYRVTRSSETATGIDYEYNIPYPLINSLASDFSQFKHVTQIHQDNNPLVSFDDKKYILDNVIFADSSFFDVFNFEVITGNAKDLLSKPNFIMLTETTAKKFYGDDDPIGKKFTLRNKLEVEVAGIIKDSPSNSHLEFEAIVSYPSFLKDYFFLPLDSWTMSAEGSAYVVVKDAASLETIDEEFKRIVNKYYSKDDASKRAFYLQPVGEIHFDQQFNNNAANLNTFWALGIIGAFILLIACVNFINLSTALAVKKSREVGVRKSLGATKWQLVRQYLLDTFLVTSLSGILSIGLTERLIPLFNQFFNKKLQFQVLENYEVLLFVVFLVLLVTLLAGAYPSFILSGYNPVKALKNNIHSQNKSSLSLRKGLIVVQFVISQILIICTVIIAAQMNFFINKPMGFEKDAIISVDISENDESTLESLRTRLLSNPAIEQVSFALAPPASNNTFTTGYNLSSDGIDSRIDTQIKPVDYQYKDLYGLEILYGRWFNPGEDKYIRDIFGDDSLEDKVDYNMSYILNETAVRKLGFNNPEEAIGKVIRTGVGGIQAPITGVVKDFHGGSLHEVIQPTILMHFPQFYYQAGIKLNNVSNESIAHVEKVFTETFPENLFEYDFLDDTIATFYEEEQRTFDLFKLFSGISILISCLGLLGMISFIINQKTKEVAVRKVLGAPINSIVFLFSKEFLLLVIIAFLVAAPAAFYSMKLWLSDFAFKIDMQVWYFIIAIAISALFTLLTIGYQSLKAALSNPVNALRSE